MITVSRNAGLPAGNSCPPDLGAVMAAAAMSVGDLAHRVGGDRIGAEAWTGHAGVAGVVAVLRVHHA
jgi:hypothetical protein